MMSTYAVKRAAQFGVAGIVVAVTFWLVLLGASAPTHAGSLTTTEEVEVCALDTYLASAASTGRHVVAVFPARTILLEGEVACSECENVSPPHCVVGPQQATWSVYVVTSEGGT